ncbi:hypothetical protein F2Q68_00001561 [Brassica cretica]|uniref:Uncharacterized protein n=1 Tax=Brassica cretica TaxID=69181 RepID=A0A8S9J658_BRACR|nr:hypothetical protein F2Q68_00001561 [Brassica cretica]
MANAAIFLFDLKTGRCSSTIQVRLLCFLEPMNVRWGSELMGVDMFLLDSQVCSEPLPEFIKPSVVLNLYYRIFFYHFLNRLAIHMPNLKVGSLYSLAGFDVTRCNQNYRLSDSSMMIRFSDSTCFDEITEPAIPIGVESFRFASCSVLPTQTLSFQPVKLHNQPQNCGRGDFYRLVAQDTGLAPAAPLLKGYDKVESLSIADLNEFVNSASSQVKLISSALRRSLVSSWTKDGATFLAPTVPRSSNALSRFHMSGLYRVEMSIPDETAEGLFVCFDWVMTKLHNMRPYEACHLLVKVSAYNFTENHQILTISCILSEGDRMPLPQFVVNGGDDDNGDDNSGAISVGVKVETGGSSQVQGSSGTKKKARKAANVFLKNS